MRTCNTWNRRRSQSGRSKDISRRASRSTAGTDCHASVATSEGGDANGSDETEVADEGRQGGIRGTEMGGGTGVRSDQTSARLSSILATRKKERARRVGIDLHDA